MKTKENTIECLLSYREISVLILVINMYCNGPEYHTASKDLSQNEKLLCNEISSHLILLKESIRQEVSMLYVDIIYSKEDLLEKQAKFSFPKEAIALVIRIFETTIIESEKDNFYELELIAAPISEVRQCLDLLKALH